MTTKPKVKVRLERGTRDYLIAQISGPAVTIEVREEGNNKFVEKRVNDYLTEQQAKWLADDWRNFDVITAIRKG